MSAITKKKKLKKEQEKIQTKITKISVIDDVYYDTTYAADPDDEWSRDSTSESHSIQGITISKYGDIECSFEVLSETDYYLLYYNYSSGDSFGHDSGRIEFVGLYDDEKLVKRCVKAMNASADKGKADVTIWNDQGKPYIEYMSCVGDYFGGFEGADYQVVQLI